MKRNDFIKIALDVLMTGIFILLMKVSFVGIALHELIGLGILFLFLIHILLNYKWVVGIWKGVVNGKSALKAKALGAVDFLLFLFVTFNVISGVFISQTILTEIHVSDTATWSNFHHFAAYSSLVILSIHIGFHWKMLMRATKKLLGVEEESPIRTFLARVMVIVIAFFGIKAITNPEMYGNFTAPFASVTGIDSTAVAQTAITTKKEDDCSQPATITVLSTNGLDIETPTLEEFLSKLFCSGCGKHCPLTSLRCNRGTQYKNEAIAKYEATYSENTSSSSSSSESSKSGGNSSKSETPSSSSSTSSFDTNENSGSFQPLPNESNALTDSRDVENSGLTPLDYLSFMGTVIAGTHYTITIPQNRQLKKKKKLP